MADRRGYPLIRPEYQLRGWQGFPYALVDRRRGTASFMGQEVFRTLQFCDGRFAANMPIFGGARQTILAELQRRGFIELLDEPGSLLPDQAYRYYDNRYVELAFWSLTGHCNYRCRHCYMSAPHAVLPQPSTEQCLDIADQLADCGVGRIALTGGEPLIRRDFFQIVDRILERGMRIDVIMTNGALVDERFLDELDARDCHPEISMSFDGPERWHDWLRGVEGAYGSVLRALALCHERGFVTECGLVLHKGNLHTLRESVNELAGLGVSSLKVSLLNCIGEGAALTDYAITGHEAYEAFLDYIPLYVEDGMPIPALKLADLFSARWGSFSVGAERHAEDEDCDGAGICADSRYALFVGPDGRVMPCCSLSELECTNVLFPRVADMRIADALSSPSHMGLLGKTLGEYLAHNPKCASCAYKNRCGGGCRARAAAANGGSDLMGVDPEACLVFKGGYYDRVKALIAELQR